MLRTGNYSIPKQNMIDWVGFGVGFKALKNMWIAPSSPPNYL